MANSADIKLSGGETLRVLAADDRSTFRLSFDDEGLQVGYLSRGFGPQEVDQIIEALQQLRQP